MTQYRPALRFDFEIASPTRPTEFALYVAGAVHRTTPRWCVRL